jgi:hypothetical protein
MSKTRHRKPKIKNFKIFCRLQKIGFTIIQNIGHLQHNTENILESHSQISPNFIWLYNCKDQLHHFSHLQSMCVLQFPSAYKTHSSIYMCIYEGLLGYLSALVITYHCISACVPYLCVLCVCAYLSMFINVLNLCLQFLVSLYFFLYFNIIHNLITQL